MIAWGTRLKPLSLSSRKLFGNGSSRADEWGCAKAASFRTCPVTEKWNSEAGKNKPWVGGVRSENRSRSRGKQLSHDGSCGETAWKTILTKGFRCGFYISDWRSWWISYHRCRAWHTGIKSWALVFWNFQIHNLICQRGNFPNFIGILLRWTENGTFCCCPCWWRQFVHLVYPMKLQLNWHLQSIRATLLGWLSQVHLSYWWHQDWHFSMAAWSTRKTSSRQCSKVLSL